MSSSPSIVSEDFSPDESPTFPIHSFPRSSPILHSPTILKAPGDRPRGKKFVNLMDPAHIQDSALDLVGRHSKPPAVTNVDIENQNKSVPFTTFTIEPEQDKDDSRVTSSSHSSNQPTQNDVDK